LFYGTHGTGKTSVARIVAKALNCEKGISGSPCNACSSCLAIEDGTNPDVFEVDGASNRGIADIRNIQDLIKYSPTNRIKVMIIDEAHMLTREAFNAFLKTLEEPPTSTVFILATTDHEALPQTVLSRCQKYVFKPLDSDKLATHLGLISFSEKINIGNDTLRAVTQYADGSVRDGLSILDQIKHIKEEVTPEDLETLMGTVPRKQVNAIIVALGEKNLAKVIESVDAVSKTGEDIKRVVANLVAQLRSLLICKAVGDPSKILPTFTSKRIAATKKAASGFAEKDLITLIVALNKLHGSMQYGMDFRIALETTLLAYLEGTWT
jgi:DNA polymerase-3 subunit gamma/tau